jgi:hypothetical protein
MYSPKMAGADAVEVFSLKEDGIELLLSGGR